VSWFERSCEVKLGLVRGSVGCVLGRERWRGREEEERERERERERESVCVYIYHFTEAAQFDIVPSFSVGVWVMLCGVS
jgi:hypothetical protein